MTYHDCLTVTFPRGRCCDLDIFLVVVESDFRESSLDSRYANNYRASTTVPHYYSSTWNDPSRRPFSENYRVSIESPPNYYAIDTYRSTRTTSAIRPCRAVPEAGRIHRMSYRAYRRRLPIRGWVLGRGGKGGGGVGGGLTASLNELVRFGGAGAFLMREDDGDSVTKKKVINVF